MREIVFDTETTGLDPAEGHRVIEIGAVELHNHVPTGRTWQAYINPERDVPADSVAVHGITEEFLKDKPVFAQVYTDFTKFIGDDAKLVGHNASFDMKFINAELSSVGHPSIGMDRVVDTLAIARKKFPGAPASLDALCRRFGIDLSDRDVHGALLDSQLLAAVYLELMGGRQHGLLTGESSGKTPAANDTGEPVSVQAERVRVFREPRLHAPTAKELVAHAKLLEKIEGRL